MQTGCLYIRLQSVSKKTKHLALEWPGYPILQLLFKTPLKCSFDSSFTQMLLICLIAGPVESKLMDDFRILQKLDIRVNSNFRRFRNIVVGLNFSSRVWWSVCAGCRPSLRYFIFLVSKTGPKLGGIDPTWKFFHPTGKLCWT